MIHGPPFSLTDCCRFRGNGQRVVDVYEFGLPICDLTETAKHDNRLPFCRLVVPPTDYKGASSCGVVS